MADDVDVATEMFNNEVSRALAKLRQNRGEQVGSKTCDECGEDMPKPRQQLGFKLCVACAQDAERRKSLFAIE